MNTYICGHEAETEVSLCLKCWVPTKVSERQMLELAEQIFNSEAIEKLTPLEAASWMYFAWNKRN